MLALNNGFSVASIIDYSSHKKFDWPNRERLALYLSHSAQPGEWLIFKMDQKAVRAALRIQRFAEVLTSPAEGFQGVSIWEKRLAS
jgi:hypothetical protein